MLSVRGLDIEEVSYLEFDKSENIYINSYNIKYFVINVISI